MNCQIVTVRIVLAALTTLSAITSANADQPVPFRGVLAGSFIRPAATAPVFDVLLTANGNATQLGRFSMVFPHRVDASTVPSFGFGSCTLIAANGDTLLSDAVGQAVLVAPNVIRIVEKHTIKGGTGRFAGASGEFVVERLANQVALTTVGSFQGTISAVGTSQR